MMKDRKFELAKKMLFDKMVERINRIDTDNSFKHSFIHQINQDFNTNYIPIDFDKEAYLKAVDNKIVPFNYSIGIINREQLNVYTEHFNRTILKLKNSVGSGDELTISLSELEFINSNASSYGKAYDSPFIFQGDLEYSKSHNLNFYKKEYKPRRYDYSVLEWATIYYYLEITQQLSKKETKKESMEQFLKENEIKTTLGNFKTSYHKANSQINKVSNYPIKKLEKILPFLTEKYPQIIDKVNNDIYYLKKEAPDN